MTAPTYPSESGVVPALVRRATAADAPAVGRVIAAAYQEYEPLLSPDLYAAYLDDLLDLDPRMTDGELLVAEIGGQVVGTVTLHLDAEAADVGWPTGSSIRALAVDPAHHGHGVARQLLVASVDRAAESGAPAVWLHTAPFMSAAVALYERFGFTRVPNFDLRAHDMMGIDDPDGPLVVAYRLELEPSAKAPDAYPLGRSEAETARLTLQNQIYGPITRQFFTAAGITRGMKVLDLGSGAGDVALLLADLVGPEGRVVGVDMNPEILETARSRVRAAGFGNVELLHGDLHDLDVPSDFDAVVGRWILMYIPDPAGLLRRARTHLRPGGIVAALESADLSAAVRAFPASPLHDRIAAWTMPPAGSSWPISDMGLRLYRTFLEAGLPAPQLRHEAPLGGGPAWPGYAFVAESVRSLLPFIEQTGAVTAEEVDVDTLEARLRAEIVARDAVQILPTVIGAWARTGST